MLIKLSELRQHISLKNNFQDLHINVVYGLWRYSQGALLLVDLPLTINKRYSKPTKAGVSLSLKVKYNWQLK